MRIIVAEMVGRWHAPLRPRKWAVTLHGGPTSHDITEIALYNSNSIECIFLITKVFYVCSTTEWWWDVSGDIIQNDCQDSRNGTTLQELIADTSLIHSTSPVENISTVSFHRPASLKASVTFLMASSKHVTIPGKIGRGYFTSHIHEKTFVQISRGRPQTALNGISRRNW